MTNLLVISLNKKCIFSGYSLWKFIRKNNTVFALMMIYYGQTKNSFSWGCYATQCYSVAFMPKVGAMVRAQKWGDRLQFHHRRSQIMISVSGCLFLGQLACILWSLCRFLRTLASSGSDCGQLLENHWELEVRGRKTLQAKQQQMISLIKGKSGKTSSALAKKSSD